MPVKQLERMLGRLRTGLAQASQISGSLEENLEALEPLALDLLDGLSEGSSETERQASEDVRRAVLRHEAPADRVLALDAALSRAVESERLSNEFPAPGELERWLGSTSLPFRDQLRIVYAFSLRLPGDRAEPAPWTLLAAVTTDPDSEASLDPVVRALRTLVHEDLSLLRPSHRTAAERARGEALGLPRLIVEEALTLLYACEWPNFAPLRFTAELLDDPALARQHPLAYADLHARIHLALAECHAVGPSPLDPEEFLETGRRFLMEGSGSSTLQARFFTADAACALARGEIHRALRDLLRANVLLSEITPVDRRAEVLMLYALVLDHHPSAAGRAPLVIETALAWLSGLADDLQPALRLKLTHFLAEIETRAVYRAAQPLHPLEVTAEMPTPERMADRFRDFSQALGEGGEGLRRAAAYVRRSLPLYESLATSALLAHRAWLLGRTVLPATPEIATLYFEDAVRAFEGCQDARRAALCRRDLAVSYAASGRLEECGELLAEESDEDGGPAAPLTALDDLALLRHDLLPGAGGRRGQDEALGQALGLAEVVPIRRDS
ncbi:MAG: hypothetical protein AAF725_08000 [Acidobacteriota bacterium]